MHPPLTEPALDQSPCLMPRDTGIETWALPLSLGGKTDKETDKIQSANCCGEKGSRGL